MTQRDVPSDMPMASATDSDGQRAAALAPAREANANGDTTQPSLFTQRAEWATRRAAKLRLWDEIRDAQLSAEDGEQCWRQVRAAIDTVREELAAHFEQADAARHLSYVPDTAAVRASREEKAATRAANRAAFWAKEYTKRGGTPEADAEVAWTHLLSEIAKVDRAELDSRPLWERVWQAFAELRVTLTSLLGPAATEGVRR